MRPDLAVAGGLAGVPFGSGMHTFASVLRGADYREEWRFLTNLEQASPWGDYDMTPTGEFEEVRFQDSVGVGLLQAAQNRSAILSFAFAAVWEDPKIAATHLKMDEIGDLTSAEIEIPNLAKPEHVRIHEDLIREFGFDLASSSIIYEGEDFVLRMYFNDHDPPHFHLMAQEDPSRTIARFAIQTLDQLAQSGWLRPALRKKVIDWALDRRAALMECWRDCRKHRHPVRLD